MKLKAPTLGSSFLPSAPGALGGGEHGALFTGVDRFIYQREITAGEGGVGARSTSFVMVSRGDCLQRVSVALTSAPFKGTCRSTRLIVHSAKHTHGPAAVPRQVFQPGAVFVCVWVSRTSSVTPAAPFG